MSRGSWGLALVESRIPKATNFKLTPAKLVLGPSEKMGAFQPSENFPRHGAANHITCDGLSDIPNLLKY